MLVNPKRLPWFWFLQFFRWKSALAFFSLVSCSIASVAPLRPDRARPAVLIGMHDVKFCFWWKIPFAPPYFWVIHRTRIIRTILHRWHSGGSVVKVFLLSHLAGLGMNLSLLLRKLTHVLLPSRLTAFQPGGPQPVCQLRLSKSLCISRAVMYL